MTTAGAANIAQNIGAAKYDRVPKILGLVGAITGVVCIVFTLFLVFFPSVLFSMFTTDPAVIDISGILVFPMALCFIGAAARAVGFSLINGSGNSKMNLIVAMFDGIVGRIGFSYILGFTLKMACRGFWIGDALAGYMPLVVAAVFYISGRWRRNDHIIKAEPKA